MVFVHLLLLSDFASQPAYPVLLEALGTLPRLQNITLMDSEYAIYHDPTLPGPPLSVQVTCTGLTTNNKPWMWTRIMAHERFEAERLTETLAWMMTEIAREIADASTRPPLPPLPE